MLASIPPLGERARHNRWSVTVTAYVLGSVVGGLALLAVFAGGFVDRSRKRRILVASDLFRAAVIGTLTLAWAFGALSMIHVILVGALVGAATALFQIADVAYQQPANNYFHATLNEVREISCVLLM